MSLNDLLDKVMVFSDPENDDFEGFPESYEEAVNAWGDSLEIYFNGLLPTSTTVVSAINLFKINCNFSLQTDGLEQMENSLIIASNEIAIGMAPAFTAIPPPPSGLDLQQFRASNIGESNYQALFNICEVIDTWLRTGTATPNSGGPPINWS